MFEQHTIVGILLIAGPGSILLVFVAGLAFIRRRSWSYFLVTLALGALAFRAVLGAITVTGLVAVDIHHLVEHLLDALVIGFLFAAIYAARTVDPRASLTERQHDKENDRNT